MPRPAPYAGSVLTRTLLAGLAGVALSLSAPPVGVFWVLRYSTAQSDSVQGLELSVVPAVLLGGVSIFGGSGGVVGMVAGVLLIRTVTHALQLAGLHDTVLTIVTGGLLIASVTAPGVLARVRACFTEPFRLNRRPVQVATTVGVAVHSGEWGQADDLLRAASADRRGA